MKLAIGRQRLDVFFQGEPASPWLVGTLAIVDRALYFEYAPEWLERGLELSPLALPLKPGPIEHTRREFGPIFGLFDDSLPDGWGLLLMDRFLHSRGLDPAGLTVLDRLALLGSRTMGALTYHPPASDSSQGDLPIDLALLASEAQTVLSGQPSNVLPELLRAGGNTGGARPKVLVGFDAEHNQLLSGEGDLPEGYDAWIVKFPGSDDLHDAGPLEYAYSLMARAAGLDMPETRLFETSSGQRFFGVKRFDRATGGRRFHIHTFGNLIQSNFRIPSCDYADLLKASSLLTRDRRALLAVFRQASFNVAVHNRDDHVKNFAFQMDASSGDWNLAPAYDLTFTSGPGGEHTMTIAGEGRAPTRVHLLKLASRFDLSDREVRTIFTDITNATSAWPDFAREAGVERSALARVKAKIGME